MNPKRLFVNPVLNVETITVTMAAKLPGTLEKDENGTYCWRRLAA